VSAPPTAAQSLAIPTSTGDRVDAWLYRPERAAGVVVMAHGIGGVKAAGLAPFAERFCAAGFAAVAFDYRHWGRSTGEPREWLSIARQREDYRTALRWVADDDELARLPRFVWGTSFAGMHIVELAVAETGLAGAIAQCPLVDGLAATLRTPPARGLPLTARALADVLGARLGRPPMYVPISVGPGELGLLAGVDALAGRERLMPSNEPWPNRITARSLLEIVTSRPVRRAGMARCPLLLVVAQHDSAAPTAPALRAATRAPGGELYRSRGGHYDVYAGGLDHDAVLRVEVDFLRRHAGA
jgi:uncharacterized protein